MPLGLFSRGRGGGGGGGKKHNQQDHEQEQEHEDEEEVDREIKKEQSWRNPRRRPSVTWKEAHSETCLLESTLCPSVRQVMDHGYVNLSDHVDSYTVILWGERQMGLAQVLQRFQAQTMQQQQQQTTVVTTTTTTPSKTSVFSRAVNLAMMPFDLLTSPFAGQPDDYDTVIPLQDLEINDADDNNNSSNNNTNRSGVSVDPNECILNVELTLQCLNTLKAIIHRGPPLILKLNTAIDDDTTESSFQHWIREQCASTTKTKAAATTTTTVAQQLLPRLPPDQISFLLQVLVAAGVVQKIARQAELGKPDLIVFPDHSSSSSTSMSVEFRLTLFDLQEAMDVLHQRVVVLEARSDAALAAARTCQKQQNRTGALYQIQRKKRLQHEIDITYKHLTNLEAQQQALRQAADTHRMQKAMEQTAETLKNIRLAKTQHTKQQQQQTNTTLTTQDLVDDLAEELERVQEDNLALAIPVMDNSNIIDDDETLLQELAEYPDPNPDDDIDVDELMEEMQLLQLTTSNSNNQKPAPKTTTTTPKQTKTKKAVKPLPPSAAGTIPASIYDAGTSTTTTTTANNNKPKSGPTKEPSKRRLASAVCL